MAVNTLEKYKMPFIAFIILTLIGNFLLVIVILSDKKLRNIPNMYHAAIAIGGLFHSVATLPWYLLITWDVIPADVCRHTTGFSFAGFTLRACLTLALAADRWIFVFKPLRYHALVTGRRVAIICLAGAIYSLAVSVTHGWLAYESSGKSLDRLQMIQFLTNGTVVFADADQCLTVIFASVDFCIFMLYGNCCFCIFVSMVMYLSILILAWKRAKSIGVVSAAGNSWIQPAGTRAPADSRRHRGTFLLLTSLLLFLVTWLPLLIGLGTDTNTFTDTARLLRNPDKVHYYTAQIVAINLEMSINPWLMAFAQRDFRRATFHLFARWLPARGGSDNGFGHRRRQTQCSEASKEASLSIVNIG